MKNLKNKTCPPVAIVGMSAIFPGSETMSGFWQNILDKNDQIKEVPTSHWLVDDYYDEDPKARDKTYGKRGGFLPNVSFDPLAFGMLPNALEATDTGQLLAMMVAKQVLDDAFKGQFSEADKSKISVILGTTGSTELILEMAGRMERPKWVKALREEGLDEDRVQSVCDRISAQYVEWQESSFPGLLANVVAGRIAHRLDLGGTNFVTDAACASSLAALNISLNELYLGHSDVVITGGVDALNTISMFMCFSKTPALSASGDCRPFSEQADGTILGEGIGMIAIKRLDDAERDGDHIYGVIKGVGYSSDGKGSSVYAPVPKGQAVCMQRAYEAAGYSPDTVELLEAHGTATKAGDVAEFEGLTHVFQSEGDLKNHCALGSIKSNIGHTKASAGIAGLMKAVLALNHKTLPPTIKVGQPRQKLNINDSAFYLNTESRPWVRGSNHPRRAGVSAFGFGGTNFHVTVEEYLQTKTMLGAKRKRTFGSELFLFSSDEVSGLSQPIISALISEQAQQNDNGFRFLIAESHITFNPKHTFKLAIVAQDIEDLGHKLSAAFGQISKSPETNFEFPNGIFYGCGLKPGKLAFVFSGQGSQYLNMGGDLAMKFEPAIACWDAQAERALWEGTSKLHQVVFPTPVFSAEDERVQNDTLKSTQWAQPAIATVSLSHLALMKTLGLEACAVAGHSLGELTALHAAGVFDEQTLLAISRERGLLMNKAAKIPGAMLAVLATAEDVETVLTRAESKVTIANYNAPNQTIVAGSEIDIAGFSELLTAQGLKFKSLPVATAFHSEIVSPSVTPFKVFLKEQRFGTANLPVFANLNGKPYPRKNASIKKQLGEQIANPVRFIDQIEAMYADGVRTFVELGPDSVLTGLVKSCLDGRDFTALALDKKGKNGIEQFWNTLGCLSVQGYALDLEKLMQGYELPVDPATIKTPKMLVTIGGANYGKKYPPIEGSSVLPKANIEDSTLKEMRAQLEQQSERTMKEELAKQLALQHQAHASSVQTTAIPDNSISTTAGNQNWSNDWQSTFREIQEETLKAQLAFQNKMAESHQAFLKTAEMAMMQSMTSPVSQGAQPVSVASSMASVASPMASTSPMVSTSPEPVISEVAKPDTSSEVQAQVQALAPSKAPKQASRINMNELMLEVVAEKTGYPSEMLNLDMHLENDLGIDSIKRVEILAAVMDAAPEIPELDNSEMAKLSTLREIVEFMDLQLPAVAATAQQSTQAESAASQVNIIDSSDLQNLMLEVVAEKTGYPTEMLNLGMHLENDLGIDSIKRVEILAGVIDQVPGLPELDNSEMAKLSTLEEIVGFIDQSNAESSSAVANHSLSQSSAYVLPEEGVLSQVARFSLKWKEAPALKLQVQNISAAATVLITDEGRGIAPALEKKFCEQGYDAHLVTALDDRLIDQAKVLVFTGGLRDVSCAKSASDINKEGFEWARRVAGRFEKNGGTLITVQDTGGQFMSELTELKDSDIHKINPYLAGLSGLCKTAALEWPNAYVKAIDIECAGRSVVELAESLFNEIVAGGFEKEVGLLKNGTRGTLVSTPSFVSVPSRKTLSEGVVIVASGGARGVTAACLIELAKALKPKIGLLGRTDLVDEPSNLAGINSESELKKQLLIECQARGEKVSPAILGQRVTSILANRDVRENIKRMEDAGATVQYFVCDIRRQESVSAALKKVRQLWGGIEGLIHGAGVIADKLIAEKTDDQFNAVFGTKIEGLNALLIATENDDLSMICLFSSVAGRSGNRGQSDYAMANEVLNKVAAIEYARRNTGNNTCQVKSINWGPWDSGMVSPALKKQFATMGIPMIPLKEGAQIFVAEVLGGSPDQVEVVVGAKPDGSLLSAADKPTRSLSFNLSEKDFEFLSGHKIAEVPVVPYMLVADWMTRACCSNWPNLKVTELKGFRCLKGIKLDEFYQQGNQIELVMQEVSLTGSTTEVTVAVSILSALGPHYSAEVILSEAALFENKEPESKEPEDKPKTKEMLVHLPDLSPLGIDSVYDGEVLFHKNEFQVIQTIIGSSEQGIEGTLSAKADSLRDQSLCSTLVLDGGLQVALLWVWQKMGGGSLPLSIESMKTYTSDFSGEIVCQVRVRSSNKQKTTVDIVYHNDKGLRLAEIIGLDLLVHFEKEFSGRVNQGNANQGNANQGSVNQVKASGEAMDAL